MTRASLLVYYKSLFQPWALIRRDRDLLNNWIAAILHYITFINIFLYFQYLQLFDFPQLFVPLEHSTMTVIAVLVHEAHSTRHQTRMFVSLVQSIHLLTWLELLEMKNAQVSSTKEYQSCINYMYMQSTFQRVKKSYVPSLYFISYIIALNFFQQCEMIFIYVQ